VSGQAKEAVGGCGECCSSESNAGRERRTSCQALQKHPELSHCTRGSQQLATHVLLAWHELDARHAGAVLGAALVLVQSTAAAAAAADGRTATSAPTQTTTSQEQ